MLKSEFCILPVSFISLQRIDYAWAFAIELKNCLLLIKNNMKIRTCLTIFLAFYSVFVCGQISFQRTYGSVNEDVGMAVASTFDGGYIMTGSYDNGKIGVIRTDSYGNSIWIKTYDFQNAESQSIIQTSDSNFVIAGSIDDDFLVFKINSIGDTIWTTRKGPDSLPFVAWDIAEDFNDNLVVVVSKEVLTAICCWPYIYKLDQFGNFLWSNGYDCPSNSGCRFEDVYIDNEGNYLVTGGTPYPNEPIARLTKIDTAGNVKWDNYYYDIYIYSNCMTQAPDGGYLISGENNYSDGVPVIKTDNDGVVENIQSYIFDDRKLNGRSIDFTNTGYYISGYTSQWEWDFFLVKIDEEMNYLWSQTYGGTSGDVCYKMESTNDGGCVLVGWTDSYGAGNKDYYLVKTDQDGLVVGQKDIEAVNSDNSIYPNPFKSSTKLSLSQYQENMSISIYSFTGQEVLRIEGISGNEIMIERQNLSCGIYFITVETDQRIIYSEKISIIN